MSGNNNSTGELWAFIQKVWGGVVFVGGVVSAIWGYLKLAEGNSSLFTWVLFGVSIFLLFLIFIFYSFFWKPELKDGDQQEDKSSQALILPNPSKPVAAQPEKEQLRKVKFRKRVRLLARLGLLIIPFLVWAGFKIYRYHTELPSEDFIILVANFEGAESQDYLVTQEIFQNLEREIEGYDKVTVEKLDKSLTSIKDARQEGEQKKAAIVIWGRYQVIDKIVPISVNFEIMKDSSEFPELGEEVRGKTQPVAIAQLNSFKLQTRLSQEMTYLSLFTLGMYRYLDEDWDRAIEYLNEALNELKNPEETISSLGRHEAAIDSYEKALEFKPDLHQAWNNKGFTLELLGRYETAIDSYDQALEFKPDYYYAWYNKAATYALQNNIDLVLKNLEQAFRLNPELREYAKTDSDFDTIREDKRFKELIDGK